MRGGADQFVVSSALLLVVAKMSAGRYGSEGHWIFPGNDPAVVMTLPCGLFRNLGATGRYWHHRWLYEGGTQHAIALGPSKRPLLRAKKDRTVRALSAEGRGGAVGGGPCRLPTDPDGTAFVKWALSNCRFLLAPLLSQSGGFPRLSGPTTWATKVTQQAFFAGSRQSNISSR